MAANEVQHAKIPCCPDLEPAQVCDTLDFSYRVPVRAPTGGDRPPATVEVELRFRLTRCSGKLALGDLAYSTTLLPGEKVKLFTSDRHSRFTFDTESRLAYRNETTSEESFFAAGMAQSMSNFSSVESGRSASAFHESSLSGGASAGIDIGIFELGGSVSGSSHDASTIAAFSRAVSIHADSSSRHAEVATRAAASTAVGEVQSRTHTQGESEDHFESSSRTFENGNSCHAVTYFFYRLNKIQKVTWDLVAVERRVLDGAAPTGTTPRPASPFSKVRVTPASVLATAKGRTELEREDRAALVAAEPALAFRLQAVAGPGVDPRARQAALDAVDKDLVEKGILAADRTPSKELVAKLHWERTIALPTPGILVKGCLDECNTCEPAEKRRIELELDRKELENELLKRQIALLDKSQEYRCCPSGEVEEKGGEA